MKTLLAALLIAPLLAACSSGTAQPDQTSAAAPTDAAVTDAPTDAAATDAPTGAATEAAATVQIVDFAFEPADATVSAGDTVRWAYDDGSSRHTVTFDDDTESGPLEPGDEYSRTFDEAGEYAYVCSFHPNMTATVTVG